MMHYDDDGADNNDDGDDDADDDDNDNDDADVDADDDDEVDAEDSGDNCDGTDKAQHDGRMVMMILCMSLVMLIVHMIVRQ